MQRTRIQVAQNSTTKAPAKTNVPPTMDPNNRRIRRQTTVVARLKLAGIDANRLIHSVRVSLGTVDSIFYVYLRKSLGPRRKTIWIHCAPGFTMETLSQPAPWKCRSHRYVEGSPYTDVVHAQHRPLRIPRPLVCGKRYLCEAGTASAGVAAEARMEPSLSCRDFRNRPDASLAA